MSHSNKVIGGIPVKQGDYSFAVALYTKFGQFYCGGSLIASNLVLTAAHCSSKRFGTAKIGCVDRESKTFCEEIPILESVIMRDFYEDSVLIRNDLMIMVLERNSIHKPIALLNTASSIVQDEKIRIVGWGNTIPSTSLISDFLLEAELSVVNSEACDLVYRALFQNAHNIDPDQGVIDQSMICAIGEGQDSCQGDSGGPIFYKCNDGTQHVQLGVVSFGLGCAYDGVPGINAKVFSREAVTFIKGQAKKHKASVSFVPQASACQENGTRPPTKSLPNPTPFPTYANAWVCPSSWFGAQDGCDCGCGMTDPDCEYDKRILNCGRGALSCDEGRCVYELTNFPTMYPTLEPTFPDFPTFSPTHLPTFNSSDTDSNTTTDSPPITVTYEPSVIPTFSPTSNPTISQEVVGTDLWYETDAALVGLIFVVGLIVPLILIGILILAFSMMMYRKNQ